MLYVLGPGGPGSLGDCSVGASVKECTFAFPTAGGAANCFQAIDHSRDRS